MRKLILVLTIFVVFVSGCSENKISNGTDTTKVFTNTISNSEKTIAKIKGYENTIIRLYLEHSVPILEQSLMGALPDSFEGDDFKPEKLEKEGIYSNRANFSVYSKSEANNLRSDLDFSSEDIDYYNDEEISKFNEISKALIKINITYGLDIENKCVVQNITITDIKDESYFIILKWKDDECVEISYKDFTYLW